MGPFRPVACPLSTKCPFLLVPRAPLEDEHLNYHASKRKKPFLKIRVLPGQTYSSDHVQVKNSFRHPIYISIFDKEKEVEKTRGISPHSDWTDL